MVKHRYLSKLQSRNYQTYFLYKCVCVCVTALLTYVSVHHVCAWCPQRSEESVGIPWNWSTGVVDSYKSCKAPCGCWEPDLGLLQEQVLMTAELALHPPHLLLRLALAPQPLTLSSDTASLGVPDAPEVTLPAFLRSIFCPLCSGILRSPFLHPLNTDLHFLVWGGSCFGVCFLFFAT